ncbi:MAG: LPS export ABC transporter periplasmic protein LptC, partial [Acinetobacter sp.]|nr:LPS export ABC transporter periplasmic protein LptC [Acinetobacter sp.]
NLNRRKGQDIERYYPAQDAKPEEGPINLRMEFQTDELTGYPKTREIETDHQVVVQSPQAEFVSKGLKANLNNGQYEFFNIRGKYAPKS